MRFSSFTVLLCLCSLSSCKTQTTKTTTTVFTPAPRVTTQTTGATATLFAVYAVNDSVVWASGSRGGVVRTTDGGKTWKLRPVPNGERLEIRDVHALSADSAFLLTIGNGNASRIYFTADGGANWKLQFQNAD